jgi:hypothetical protein
VASIVDGLRSLQAERRPAVCRPRPGDRIGFSLSTRDRFVFTLRTLKTIDTEGGFDVVWNDGSERREVPELSRYFIFKNARLAEVNYGVKGGADAAICFGLRRMLDLGYDYIGLIENDIILQPGWFQTLLSLFDLAAAEGLAVGAASVLGYQSRVLEYRRDYSIDWARGAAMVLFTRPAAQLLLDNYSSLKLTSQQVRGFYAERFGVALHVPEWMVGSRWMDGPMSVDWGFAAFLYSHGYACVGSISSLTYDLEFDVQQVMRTDYVDAALNESGLAHPRMGASVGVSEGSRVTLCP